MKSALYAAIVFTIAYVDPDMRGKHLFWTYSL